MAKRTSHIHVEGPGPRSPGNVDPRKLQALERGDMFELVLDPKSGSRVLKEEAFVFYDSHSQNLSWRYPGSRGSPNQCICLSDLDTVSHPHPNAFILRAGNVIVQFESPEVQKISLWAEVLQSLLRPAQPHQRVVSGGAANQHPSSPTRGPSPLSASAKSSPPPSRPPPVPGVGSARDQEVLRLMKAGTNFFVYLPDPTGQIQREEVFLFCAQEKDGFYFYLRDKAETLTRLPLMHIKEMVIGKESPCFKSKVAARADSLCCFSLITEVRTFGFEAPSPGKMALWAHGIHLLMSKYIGRGTTRIVSDDPRPEAAKLRLSQATLFTRYQNQPGIPVASEVLVWYRAAAEGPGSICWAEPSGGNFATISRDQFHDLPLTALTDVQVGKITPGFQTKYAQSSADDRKCFTLVFRGDPILELETSSSGLMHVWLTELHTLLSMVEGRPFADIPALAKKKEKLMEAMQLLEKGAVFRQYETMQGGVSARLMLVFYVPDHTRLGSAGRMYWTPASPGVKSTTGPSLAMDEISELRWGKETDVLKSMATKSAQYAQCFSIHGKGLVIHLQADDEDTPSVWLRAIHRILTHIAGASVKEDKSSRDNDNNNNINNNNNNNNYNVSNQNNHNVSPASNGWAGPSVAGGVGGAGGAGGGGGNPNANKAVVRESAAPHALPGLAPAKKSSVVAAPIAVYPPAASSASAASAAASSSVSPPQQSKAALVKAEKEKKEREKEEKERDRKEKEKQKELEKQKAKEEKERKEREERERKEKEREKENEEKNKKHLQASKAEEQKEKKALVAGNNNNNNANNNGNGLVIALNGNVVNNGKGGVAGVAPGAILSLRMNIDPRKVFKLKTKLGEGSYATVYRALDLRDNSEVAVKVLQLFEDITINDVMREIDVLKRVDSPHVARLKGALRTKTQVWIAMELCAAGSLRDMMHTCKQSLHEDEIACVMSMLLQGLQYLHSQGVLHRDIKAANLLVTSDAQCKVADFGVSTDNVYRKHTQIGSPYWMAPEVIMGHPYDAGADLWSVGITAIELAVGQPPWVELEHVTAMSTIATGPPPALPIQPPSYMHLAAGRKLPEKWSWEFVDFITRCLKKNPAERPAIGMLLKHPFVTRGRERKPFETYVRDCNAEIASLQSLNETGGDLQNVSGAPDGGQNGEGEDLKPNSLLGTKFKYDG